MIELFSGNGTIAEAFKSVGQYNVKTLDLTRGAPQWMTLSNDQHNHMQSDVLRWPFQYYLDNLDFLWASPPCKTHSILAATPVHGRTKANPWGVGPDACQSNNLAFFCA